MPQVFNLIKKNQKEDDKRIILPWLGLIEKSNCQGLEVNYGLYTQCTNKPEKKDLCLHCVNLQQQTGTVTDRLKTKGVYKDKFGNKEVNYLKVIQELNINIAEANKYCNKIWNINLPDKYLIQLFLHSTLLQN